MKKQRLFTLLVAAIALLASTSCSTVRTVKTAKELSTEGKLHQNATLLDVSVGEKVSHTITFSYSSFSKNPRTQHSLAKEIDFVTAELLAKSGGDILLERRYTSTKKLSPMKLVSTVTVEGYVGKYDNFRSLTPSDSLLIEVNNMADGIYRPASKVNNLVIH